MLPCLFIRSKSFHVLRLYTYNEKWKDNVNPGNVQASLRAPRHMTVQMRCIYNGSQGQVLLVCQEARSVSYIECGGKTETRSSGYYRVNDNYRVRGL